MIQLEQRYVDAVLDAASPADLHESVQHAIELEFATLPPYLNAVFSLREGHNDDIRDILLSVAMDEMLHMLLACNLLVAIGGTPRIANPQFVPKYPSPLPMGVSSNLVVGIERFSINLVRDTFMAIEHPENPLQFPAKSVAESRMDRNLTRILR